MKTLTISEFARGADIRPSFVTQLINDKRIPEAVRDEEDGRYRVPARRCVIPSRLGRKGGKIKEFYFRRDEIPQEWIEAPDSRPGAVDENGHFVGVLLEGDENETLASRIERTFGVKTGGVKRREEVPKGKKLFPSLFMRCPVRVEMLDQASVEGILVDVDEGGIVLSRECGAEAKREQNGGVILCFLPWASVQLIEAHVT